MTTDWVLLTALLIGLALSTFNVVSGGTENMSEDIASTASNFTIKTSFD